MTRLKELSGVLDSPKQRTNEFFIVIKTNLFVSNKNEFVCSFFVRIKDNTSPL